MERQAGCWLEQDREGYLLGHRQFGIGMIVRHAFDAGTNPGTAFGDVHACLFPGGVPEKTQHGADHR